MEDHVPEEDEGGNEAKDAGYEYDFEEWLLDKGLICWCVHFDFCKC